MVSKLKYAVLVAALGFSVTAMAAEKQSELSIAGSLSSLSSKSGGTTTTSDMTNISLAYGYYFSSQMVGQVNLNFISAGSAGSTMTIFAPGAGVKYYFQPGSKGDTVPFAGARLDLISISESGGTSGSGTQITGFVGASNFVSETASLDLTLSLSAGSVTINSTSVDQTNTTLAVGFTQRF